jgi:hypothetical protein
MPEEIASHDFVVIAMTVDVIFNVIGESGFY